MIKCMITFSLDLQNHHVHTASALTSHNISTKILSMQQHHFRHDTKEKCFMSSKSVLK